MKSRLLGLACKGPPRRPQGDPSIPPSWGLGSASWPAPRSTNMPAAPWPCWLCTCPSQHPTHPSRLSPASTLLHLLGKFLLVFFRRTPSVPLLAGPAPSPWLESHDLSSRSAERRLQFKTNRYTKLCSDRDKIPVSLEGCPHGVPAVLSLESQSVEWEGTE